jgi:hypothetical protein
LPNPDVVASAGAPAVREPSDSVGVLHAIGRRAYTHAAGLSRDERVNVLAQSRRDWDRTTAGTLYGGGVWHTRDGAGLAGTWQELGQMMVDYSRRVVPEKTQRAWFTPALSSNGRCRDQDMVGIEQVSFDCDGGGDWDVMRFVLENAGLAYIMQRSSSHRPEHPKWHLHIPLVTPWSGTKKEWRRIYRHCVGWFSGVAELAADLEGHPPTYGFDARTDRLGQPWFLPARRNEEDPVPETVVVDGGALELVP